MGPTTPSQRTPQRSGLLRLLVALGSLLAIPCLIGLQCQPSPSSPFSTATQRQPIINGSTDLSLPGIGAIVTNRTRSFCTGTLITHRLVLTAGHCIQAIQRTGSGNVQFRMDFSQPNGTQYEYAEIQSVYIHPDYKGGKFGHETDLGLLLLKQPVQNADPIAIWQTSMPMAWIGKTVDVVGYGYIQTQPTFKRATDKQSASIPITQIQPRSFIHYDPQTKKSACHGDSGGPALMTIDGIPYVVGVTSVAYKANPSSQPGLTLCDGGARSTRVDTSLKDFLLPYLIQYADTSTPCANTMVCTPCQQCQSNSCQPTPTNSVPNMCRPCQMDQDCGAQGVCHRFSNGYRCLQPCGGRNTQCCPSGYACTTRQGNQPLSHPGVCFPTTGTCPPAPCKQDTDCGAGEACKDKVCHPTPPSPSSALCTPCHSSSQCGPGNTCYNAQSSLGYCLQACGKGRFCPQGFQCQDLAPGVTQCVPTDGCFRPCQTDNACPSDFQCTNNRCVRKQLSKAGDFCDAKQPCRTGLTCLGTSTGGRCVAACGPKPGEPGSPCINGACNNGFQCVKVSSTLEVCLEVCTNICKRGGRCFRLAQNFSACLCQQDNDCSTGQFCNQGTTKDLNAGACAPIKTNECPPGQICAAHAPKGNYCQPKQGERTLGQRCSFLEQCKAGLQCIQPTNHNGSFCLQPCTGNSCAQGQLCLPWSNQKTYCSCRDNQDCPNGFSCLLLEDGSQSRIGLCQPIQPSCRNDLDCPSEYRCITGTCQFDAERINEPFPEHHPFEPTPEPTTTPEPILEPTPEPTTTPEPAIEPTTEPTPDAAPEPQPEPTITTPEPSPEPKPTAPDIPTEKACGCSTQTPPYTHLLWILLLGWSCIRKTEERKKNQRGK